MLHRVNPIEKQRLEEDRGRGGEIMRVAACLSTCRACRTRSYSTECKDSSPNAQLCGRKHTSSYQEIPLCDCTALEQRFQSYTFL